MTLICNQSAIKQQLINSEENGWLLGDSGYPLETCLMTPVIGTTTNQQNKYNFAHTHSRVVIENSFGVLKMRYRCLDRSAGKTNLRGDEPIFNFNSFR